jgi:hypothetical protein
MRTPWLRGWLDRGMEVLRCVGRRPLSGPPLRVREFLSHTNGMKNPPASTHELTAWRIGFRAGLAGDVMRIPPPGIDCRVYVAGLIEGRAARGQRVVRLPVGKR